MCNFARMLMKVNKSVEKLVHNKFIRAYRRGEFLNILAQVQCK